MSKSIGNVIDPLDVIDGISLDNLLKKRTESLINDKQKSNIIKKTKKEFPNGIKEFGADALRFNFCAMASTGRDINFDLNRIEGYRNFCNKLWNASRFIILTCDDYNYEENLSTIDATIFDKWIMYKLDYVINDFKKYSSTYRFDLMANSIYEFVWNEYCDWYLEIAKTNTSDTTKKYLIYSLIRIIKICHPIIPFITEEIWSALYKNQFVSEESLTNSSFPSQVRISKESDIDIRVNDIKEIIKKIRRTRTELGIHPKNKFNVEILINDSVLSEDVADNIMLVNSLSGIDLVIIDKRESESNDFIEIIDSKFTLYLYIKNMISISDEIMKIEKNILHLESVLKKIDTKLNNKSFIEKAPSEIINQNVSNHKKMSNEILSIKNLKYNLSD